MVKSIYRVTMSSPFAAITMLLYIQAEMIQATVKHATLDKCLQRAPGNYFANTCHPFDELPEYFDIITNVPDLADVQYLFFAEVHQSLEDRTAKINWINNFVLPDDIILFEGFDRRKTLQCSSIAADAVAMYAAHEVGKLDPLYPYELVNQGRFKLFGLSDALTCKGWDDEGILSNEMEGLVVLYAAVRDLEKVRHKVLSVIKDCQIGDKLNEMSLSDSKKLFGKFIMALGDEIFSAAAKKYLPSQKEYHEQINNKPNGLKIFSEKTRQYLFADLASLGEKFLESINLKLKLLNTNHLQLLIAGTIARNRAAIETFKHYKSYPARIFSIFGSSHLGETFKTVVNKTHPAHELRTALGDLPHAILYRKI